MSANHRPLKLTPVGRCNRTWLRAIEDYVMSVANIDDTANNNVVMVAEVGVGVVVVAAVVLVVAVVVAWTALIPIVRKRIVVRSVEQATAPLDINDEYDELGDEDDSCCLSNATTLMPRAS